jgi:hypothetical protein
MMGDDGSIDPEDLRASVQEVLSCHDTNESHAYTPAAQGLWTANDVMLEDDGVDCFNIMEDALRSLGMISNASFPAKHVLCACPTSALSDTFSVVLALSIPPANPTPFLCARWRR